MRSKRGARKAAAVLTFVLTVTGSVAARADPDPATIQPKVEALYQWYLQHTNDTNRQPEFLSPGIDRFITPKMKARLRREYLSSSLPDDVDPIMQAQDWADHVSIAVSPPTGLPDDPRVVVHLKSFDPMAICVHLVRSGQAWKISKVDGNDAADAPADCKTKTLP